MRMMHRHLAAFEALDARRRNALVWPLLAAPGGLAETGADAPAHADAPLARTVIVGGYR
jgi:hypothetical protein